MLEDLEGQQWKDGGQRRKDGSRQPFVIKNKQKNPTSTQTCIPMHPFHIQWLPIDVPIKFKVTGDRGKGTSKKTQFSMD